MPFPFWNEMVQPRTHPSCNIPLLSRSYSSCGNIRERNSHLHLLFGLDSFPSRRVIASTFAMSNTRSSLNTSSASTLVDAKAMLNINAAEPKEKRIAIEESSTVFLFPGQGAQKLGMTKDVLNIERVKEMYKVAEDILGYNLKEIVLGDDKGRLDDTAVCQPAMLLAGLSAVEKLKEDNPEAIDKCVAAAGLSLGEYTALVHAGAMSLEDALKVVKVRGEMMQRASELSKGAMLSVIGVADDELKRACEVASAATKKEAVIANFLSKGIRVVSGDEDAVLAVKSAVEPHAVKVALLSVSGAFHTSLMAPAVDALRDVLQSVEISMPSCPVYSNTLGRTYESVDEIREQLVVQVASPVLWDTTLSQVADLNCAIYELGPQRQIKSMLRKMDMKAFKRTKNVAV
eukprot:m.97447 g.97447  ORF g.97447 m.97447 type:complete len:402 (-) comp12496_c1_seq4:132-1337(-)